jgi:hypothetical protein
VISLTVLINVINHFEHEEGGVMIDYILRGETEEFTYFEGSQTVPALSGKGTFESG